MADNADSKFFPHHCAIKEKNLLGLENCSDIKATLTTKNIRNIFWGKKLLFKTVRTTSILMY